MDLRKGAYLRRVSDRAETSADLGLSYLTSNGLVQPGETFSRLKPFLRMFCDPSSWKDVSLMAQRCVVSRLESGNRVDDFSVFGDVDNSKMIPAMTAFVNQSLSCCLNWEYRGIQQD